MRKAIWIFFIYFTRYVHKKLIKMLSLCYRGLIWKIKEHEKIFDNDDYMLDKVWDKIKLIIGIEKFDDIKILIETHNKLPNEVTLKNVAIIITCAIK